MAFFVLLLVVAAVVLFALAAWGLNPARPHLGWLGLTLLAVVLLLTGVHL
jgi:hypothetical protein